MKIILEIPELEEIVKENISSKYPNQDAKVTVQNKRNGIEVTVVLTDKLIPQAFPNVSEVLIAEYSCKTTEEVEAVKVAKEEENYSEPEKA